MGRGRRTLPLIEGVEVLRVAAEGRSLARVGEQVLFIPFVVPGDVVDVQVTRRRSGYMEGRAVRLVHASSLRAEPFCPHFGVCGGCKWQCLQYAEQLSAKQQQVVDQLVRIGKVDVGEVLPIVGSERTSSYRNKLEFAFSNRRWLTQEEVNSGAPMNRSALGFHISGAFDKVLDIVHCALMDGVNDVLRNAIRAYAVERGLSFYDLRENRGLLRSLMLRTSSSGELMLLVQFRIEDAAEERAAMDLLGYVAETFRQVTSLLWVDNHKANDAFGDQTVHTFSGSDCIYEHMGELRFKVGPKSFYQTNSEQAHNLYKVVLDFAHLSGVERVYDLYTGTGTIANFVAPHAERVIGIEYVPEAIQDARVNSHLNGIDNTEFYAGDMKDILTAEFIQEHGHPDVIITDPPRAGMHPAVVETLLAAAPGRIVYVSCNPATQARDLALLASAYRVEQIRPVDMFPHTQHVENVALLVKN